MREERRAHMHQRVRTIIHMALLAGLLAGCRSGNTYNEKPQNVIYCLDREEEALEYEDYSDEGETPDESVKACLDRITAGPESRRHRSLLPEGVNIQDWSIEDGIVTIDFSYEYLQMEKSREVLARAGIVQTLTRLQNIGSVYFTVDGNPVTDSKGQDLGVMTADTFIENAGRLINTYSHASINLYYAAEDGKHLKKESRSIYYSSSKPLEWAVVERLIRGPKVKGNHPTVPSNVHIISITNVEGVCYVNLDSSFLTGTLTVSPEATIYSIVNSLVEDCSVTAVQFSVNGESDVTIGNDISLKDPFQADMSLVEE